MTSSSTACGCPEGDYCETGTRLKEEADRRGSVWAGTETNAAWAAYMDAWDAFYDHLQEANDAANE